MLHVILTILKVIGIILLVIICLIVALLLLILFVPLRYQLYAYKQEEDIRVRGKATWLLHAVSVSGGYEEKKVDYDIRILGLSLKKLQALLERRAEKKKAAAIEGSADEKASPKGVSDAGGSAGADAGAQIDAGETDKESAVKPQTGGISLPEGIESKETGKDDGNDTEVTPSDVVEETEKDEAKFSKWLSRIFDRKAKKESDKQSDKKAEKNADQNTDRKPAGSLFEWLSGLVMRISTKFWHAMEKLAGLLQKIFEAPDKLHEFLKKIGLTIRSFCDRIEEWKSFVRDERTRGALRHGFREVGRVFKHVRPRKLKGRLTVGFDDPSVTGELIGAVSIFYPFLHTWQFQVTPVFDRQVLNGEAQIKGRIMMCVFLGVAWRLFFDKNIRFVMRKFQSKEG